VPKSRIRKKNTFTPPPEKKATVKVRTTTWVVPVMLALFLVGLAWIVVFYLTGAEFPIRAIGNMNIVIGFAMIAAGFAVSTQWK
jgi:hypothetical protein